MATEIGDFKNRVLTVPAIYPASVADTNVSAVVDMIDGDDRCFALQIVGSVSGVAPTLAGKIQESADNAVWTDVLNASFAVVSVATNTQVLVFERTKRYLRHNRTVTGTAPTFQICVLIGQQRKSI